MEPKIRSTESHPHPIWNKLIKEYAIAEIQGFILSCTDEELIAATKAGSNIIKIQCIEAAEYYKEEDLNPYKFFDHSAWINKINASSFFNSSLLLLSHKPNDTVLFRLHEAKLIANDVNLIEIKSFITELDFIEWWTSIKRLAQTKKTSEARPRQNQTIFDSIIEKYDSSWGGNIDGFLLTDNNNNKVKAIIEIRQSHSFLIERYDPAEFFSGTSNKGGDFKTWLPMVYLKKAFNIPIILITFSTKSENQFGYTEVYSISNKKLFYVDNIPPTKNVTKDFNIFQKWLSNLIDRN